MSANSATVDVEPARASAARRAAVVFGAALGLGGGYSAAYFATIPVFLKPVAEAFALSRAEASLVASLSQLGVAAAAPFAGLMIDRRGARDVIAGSVLLFAFGVFLLPSFPGNLLAFAALTFLIGLVAAGTAPVGYLSVLPRVFGRRLGLALGLSMVGIGVGAAVFPIAAQAWIAAYGWQAAYRLIAGMVLLLGMVAVTILSWGAGSAASAGVLRQGRPGSGAGDKLRAALRAWRFWLIVAVFFFTGASLLGAAIHMSALLTDRGVPSYVAAQTVSLIGVGVVVGRIGTGALLDRFPARAVAAAVFALGGAGLWTVEVETQVSFPVIAGGAVLLGFAVGAEGDVMPFIVRRQFGPKRLGLLYGIVFAAYALGAVAGPVMYALVFDASGSYSLALEAGIVACASCALFIGFIGPYRYGTETG